MPICRPANGSSAVFHDREAVCIRERKTLVIEAGQNSAYGAQFRCAERLHGERGQCIEKCKELRCTMPVVAAQKPSMGLGDDQS